MRAKLGLTADEPEDAGLVDDILDTMREGQADFMPESTQRSRLIDRMVSAANNLGDDELEIAVLQAEVILRLQNEKDAAEKAKGV